MVDLKDIRNISFQVTILVHSEGQGKDYEKDVEVQGIIDHRGRIVVERVFEKEDE